MSTFFFKGKVSFERMNQKAYLDLLHYAGLVTNYAVSAIPELTDYKGHNLEYIFRGHELSRMKPAMKLLVTFCSPSPIPTERRPKITAKPLRSMPTD